MIHCPLCQYPASQMLEDHMRSYYLCSGCQLVFADPASHLDSVSEKSVYDLHENDPADPGYREFLGRLSSPLLERLTPGQQGLDYGSGPGPTLSLMLQEAGMKMSIYDPFYAPERNALLQQYDFITCTEVVEHFCHPARDWQLLCSILRPGGVLAVMTQPVISPERFSRWHYKNDPTHVSFYSSATFDWLGEHYGLQVERVGHDVFLLTKAD